MVDTVEGNAHHRTAHDDLFRLFSGAAGRLDNILDTRADRHDKVTRCIKGGTVKRHSFSGQRDTFFKIKSDETQGTDIHNKRMHVDRKFSRRYFSAGEGIDQHLFRALRIDGLKSPHFNVRVLARLIYTLFDLVGEDTCNERFIVLDTDDRLRDLKPFHDF